MRISIISYLLSSGLCIIVMPLLIRFSLKLKMYDDHDLYRKTHGSRISRFGGIGIFVSYVTVLQLYADFSDLGIHALIASSVVMFCLGLKDDLLRGAKPSEKFIVQVLATFVFVFFGNAVFGEINIFPTNPFLESSFLQILSFITILFVVNAFNFVDGVNGLAGTLGVMINLFIGTSMLILGDHRYAVIAFTLAGATTGFLFFNFFQGRVFMGDSGAMVIGLNTVGLCLRLTSIADSSLSLNHSFSILGIMFALLIIPIFDVFRIFFIRAIQNKPLLVGDRNHIHHRLRDLGLKDYQIVFVLMGFTLMSVVFAIVTDADKNCMVIGVLSLGCLLANTLLTYLRGRYLFGQYKISDIIFIDTFNRR